MMEFSIASTAGTKQLIKNLNQASKIVTNANKTALTTASLIFQAKAKEETPVATSNLRKNIKYKVASDGTQSRVYVDEAIEYAEFQEKGTRAHGPKTAKVLAWKTKSGDWIHAKWVQGIKGKWFMKKGSEELNNQRTKVNNVLFDELQKGLGLK